MKTENGGGTWTALYSETMPDGSIRSRGLDVTTTYGVHFDPFNPDHIAISYTDIGYWHSYDRGSRPGTATPKGIPALLAQHSYWLEFDPEIKDKVFTPAGAAGTTFPSSR